MTDYSDYPPEARKVPRVGGFINPNPEAILALRPDLVVATPNVGNRPFVERVMAAGARVEVVQARNYEEIFPAIEAVASACRVPGRGSRLVAELREAIAAQMRRVTGRRRPRVLFCLQIEPLMAAGRGSYPGDLVGLAGGENVAPPGAGSYPRLSVEEVVRLAPDIIVQSLMDTGAGASGDEALRGYWGRYPSLPAVRDRRVFTVPGDALLRPGPRIADGIGILIGILHPDAPAPDTRAGRVEDFRYRGDRKAPLPEPARSSSGPFAPTRTAETGA